MLYGQKINMHLSMFCNAVSTSLYNWGDDLWMRLSSASSSCRQRSSRILDTERGLDGLCVFVFEVGDMQGGMITFAHCWGLRGILVEEEDLEFAMALVRGVLKETEWSRDLEGVDIETGRFSSASCNLEANLHTREINNHQKIIKRLYKCR